eukprot:944796-Pleurochrysis_carterae.AAC.4
MHSRIDLPRRMRCHLMGTSIAKNLSTEPGDPGQHSFNFESNRPLDEYERAEAVMKSLCVSSPSSSQLPIQAMHRRRSTDDEAQPAAESIRHSPVISAHLTRSRPPRRPIASRRGGDGSAACARAHRSGQSPCGACQRRRCGFYLLNQRLAYRPGPPSGPPSGRHFGCHSGSRRCCHSGQCRRPAPWSRRRRRRLRPSARALARRCVSAALANRQRRRASGRGRAPERGTRARYKARHLGGRWQKLDGPIHNPIPSRMRTNWSSDHSEAMPLFRRSEGKRRRGRVQPLGSCTKNFVRGSESKAFVSWRAHRLCCAVHKVSLFCLLQEALENLVLLIEAVNVRVDRLL